MEISCKNWQVEALTAMMRKVAATKDPVPKWHMSTKLGILNPLAEAINDAKKPPEDLGKYKRENEVIAQKYGKKVGEAVANTGEIFPRYEFHDKPAYEAELALLNEKYKEVIEAEPKRMEGVKELLDKDVVIDLEPIEYEWIGELLDGNELTFLRTLNMVLPPKDLSA